MYRPGPEPDLRSVSRRSLLRAGLTTAAIAPAAATLASCAATAGPATARPAVAPKAPGEKVTLTYWSWWPDLQAVCDIWNKDHPDIQVKAVTIPGGLDGGYAKMFNSLVAGNQPDLAQVEYFQIPSFLLENGLEDLNLYGAEDAAPRFVDWQWQQCSYLDKQFGIPVDSGPMMLFYRADRYKKWGIEAPTTWEEYGEAARAVHKADPDSAIESFPTGEADWLMAMCMQAGAQWFANDGETWTVNFLDDGSRKVVGFWQDLVESGVLNLTHSVWTTGWMRGLQTGEIGSWTVASWGDAILRGNDPKKPGRWDVAPLPQWEGAKRTECTWGGSASVVPSGAAHPHEAVRFATWMSTNREAVDALVEKNGIGWGSADGVYKGSVRDKADEYFSGRRYNDLVEKTVEYVPTDWTWGPTLSTMKNHISDAFRGAVADGGSFVDALRTAQDATVLDMRNKGLSVKGAS